MKKAILVSSFVLISLSIFSQGYKTGLGVRLGSFSGISGKFFLGKDKAIEGILSSRWHGFVIAGLFEYQKPISGAPGLSWFAGGGVHIGAWDGGDYYWKNDPHEDYVIIGIDLIAGLEYKFKEAPISLGLDIKPAFNLVGDNHWWSDGALSVRFCF